VPHPGDPPEQPDYLGRSLPLRQIGSTVVLRGPVVPDDRVIRGVRLGSWIAFERLDRVPGLDAARVRPHQATGHATGG
jgi:hypothetical protein